MVLRKRKPLRLADYDYSTPGAYFVTICTQGRICLFEPVPIRAMIQKWWNELPHKFPGIETDEFVVMPNHTHGIILITDPNTILVPGSAAGGHEAAGGHAGPPLPAIMQWYKTMTTNEYIRGVKQLGWPPFPGKLWQRSYHEHIIRDDREYNAIRHYIRENPANWHRDRNNMKDPGL